MFPMVITVGKVVLMSLGGLAVVGSVMSLAQKRGRDIVDLDDYQWADENGEMVEWDDLEDYEQASYLEDVMNGTVTL